MLCINFVAFNVYKDTKLTIDFRNETISDKTDPIYDVATSDFPEQYQINDTLKKNDILEDDALTKSKNVNHMDVIYHSEDEGKPRIDPFDGW